MGINVNKQPGPASRQHVGDTAAQRQTKRAHAATVLAGIRAGGTPPQYLPMRLFKALSGLWMERESDDSSADRCGGSAGWASTGGTEPSCFPLNCGMWTTPRAPTTGFYDRLQASFLRQNRQATQQRTRTAVDALW